MDMNVNDDVNQPPALVERWDRLKLPSAPKFAFPEDEALSGFAKTSLRSNWISEAGFIIGEGTVSQNIIGLNYAKLRAFVWQNFDFASGQTNEIDVGFGYEVFSRNLGTGVISLSLGAQTWMYPSAQLSENASQDFFATATLAWQGPIRLEVDYKHLFGGQSTQSDGDLLVFKIGKEHEIHKFSDGAKLSINVQVQAPLRNNFFTEGSAFPCIQAGGGLKYSKDNWQVELGTKHQWSLDKTTPERTAVNCSVGINF